MLTYFLCLGFLNLRVYRLFLSPQIATCWNLIPDVMVFGAGVFRGDPMDCSLPGSSVHGILQA